MDTGMQFELMKRGQLFESEETDSYVWTVPLHGGQRYTAHVISHNAHLLSIYRVKLNTQKQTQTPHN